jgi:hypothetical protein
MSLTAHLPTIRLCIPNPGSQPVPGFAWRGAWMVLYATSLCKPKEIARMITRAIHKTFLGFETAVMISRRVAPSPVSRRLDPAAPREQISNAP